MSTENSRLAGHPVAKIFLDRWSPRAFTGEAMPQTTLFTILEAARWAPSSYNSQPWRFLYAPRDSAHWDKFLDLLIPFNQTWAKTGSVLMIVVSEKLMSVPGKDAKVPSHSHSLDTGAAWGYLALQASMLGWHAHGMAGFDMERAAKELNISDDYRVEMALVIGKLGPKTQLPEQLQARETPSDRLPISELAFEGGF